MAQPACLNCQTLGSSLYMPTLEHTQMCIHIRTSKLTYTHIRIHSGAGIYTYTYRNIRKYLHKHTDLYHVYRIYILTYICICIPTHIHIWYTHIHSYMYNYNACTRTYNHTCIHTYIYMHTYIHTHMYTHKHTNSHGKLHFTGSVRAWSRKDVPYYYQPKQPLLQAIFCSIINTFQVKRWDNVTVRYKILTIYFGRDLLLNLLFSTPNY
jgi:hypothetical protein